MARTVTLEKCEKQIELWSNCLEALSEGKTFQVGDRILSYENAEIAKSMLDDWIGRKNRIVRSNRKLKRFRGVSGHASFDRFGDY